MKTSSFKKIATFLTPALLFAALLILGFQNCGSRVDFAAKNAELSGIAQGPGDGGPVEGKPLIGNYYRQLPGFTCGGQKQALGVIEVTATQLKRRLINPVTCHQVESELSLADLEFDPRNPDLLGVNEGAYVRLSNTSEATRLDAPHLEVWCQTPPKSSVFTSISVNEVPSLRILKAEWKLGSVALRTDRIVRTLDVNKINYNSDQIQLAIDTSQLQADGKHPAQLLVRDANATLWSGSIGCRIGSWNDAISQQKIAFGLDFGSSQNVAFAQSVFERSSTATYFDAQGVMRVAAPGQIRIDHDPITRVALGALIEGASENKLKWTESLEHTPFWDTRGSLVIPDVAVNPHGLKEADLLYESELNEAQGRSQVVDVVAGTPKALSVFAKQPNTNSRRFLELAIEDLNATDKIRVVYDLATGGPVNQIISPSASKVTVRAMNVGGGWYRLVLTGQVNATANRVRVGFYLRTSAQGPTNYSGDSQSGLYVWGAQFEEGPAPTSYIRSNDIPVTRSADNLMFTSVDWLNTASGTMLIDAHPATFGASERTAGLFALTASATTALSEIVLGAYFDPATFFRAVIQSPASQQSDWVSTSGNSASGIQSLALIYGSSSNGNPLPAQFVVNGTTTPSPYAGLTAIKTPRQLAIGKAGSAHWNGHIRTLRYWPQPLDAGFVEELQGK